MEVYILLLPGCKTPQTAYPSMIEARNDGNGSAALISLATIRPQASINGTSVSILVAATSIACNT